MIPASYREHGCFGQSYSDPKERARHKGHKSGVDCYLLTWKEPPLPWVKGGPPRSRCWHLAYGFRRGTGALQIQCGYEPGPGPYEWRDAPALGVPGVWTCKACLAKWTKGVASVTVRVDPIKVTRKQLEALIAEMPTADLAVVELRPTAVEDSPALIAEWEITERNEGTKVRYLLVGSGVVKL